MKKRFLPFSLLLVIMILGQSVIADQGGHYVPRTQPTTNAESFMGSLRANQNTGLIDPADMFKAMQQASATRNAADSALYWINMGPDNMGGQTTAIVYDNTPNSHGDPNGVVYIGSKGGGIYKSYNNGITWHHVGGLNLMVSCMVQDADGVIYVGTGDGGDAVNHNGLSQQGYSNSFIGKGIYAIDARDNDAMTRVVAATDDEWLFVNDLAIYENFLLAATNEGLKYSSDKGRTWQVAIEGVAGEVKALSSQEYGSVIVAAVDGQIYIGTNPDRMVCHSGTSSVMQGDTLLPKAGSVLDVAIAPHNANVIYAACIGTDGNHQGVYVSENKGENWTVAFPAVTNGQGHTLYDGYGVNNHGLVVDPNQEGIVYVLGLNLWSLKKSENNSGFYIADQVSFNTLYMMPTYVHVGMHAMVFNPNNSNECFIGTDGGIFKGHDRFSFEGCNRNYITTRMFNVACSGSGNRVLAAGLDHGVVKIEGDESANTMGTGIWINPTGYIEGVYDESAAAGPCAISTINPNTIFVTYKGGGIQRSATAGEDWVSTNFTSALTISTSSFRMPILLYENYEDTNNPETVWYFNTTDEDIPSGTTVQVISNNDYPFDYKLTSSLAAGDSIEVHDPITAKLFLSFTDALYMTRTPLDFAVEAEWYKLAGRQVVSYIGEPLSMGISSDGDNLFVGFKDGKLMRVTNLNTVVDSQTGTYSMTAVDSLGHSSVVLNPECAVVTTALTLPTSGQCVTSVSVDPRDANNVIVTCGNYGNDNYVFYSTNALADEPTFVSKQANLPKMPVYSSVIEMQTGHVIIGTEYGIYRTKNITNPDWTSEGFRMGEVPVMDLKQQIYAHEDEETVNITEEGAFVTLYPGVHNTGIIYAATYGRGIFCCENYKQETGTSVPETPAVAETQIEMYPNPVQSQATLSFDVTTNDNVSYQVFDMSGRMVMNQNLGRMAEGSHQVTVNAENLSTGAYILRLNKGAKTDCVKFLVY